MSTNAPMTLKDKVAIIASAVAVTISLVTFFRDNLFGQHALKASVAAIDSRSDASKLRADILLVNSGKHSEVLYRAHFIFSEDLSKGGGSLSPEFIGPVVLEPGKAVLLRLETSAPRMAALREDGTIKNPQSGIHVGVVFETLTPAGELREGSKIYRFTEFKFSGEEHVSSKPRPGDSKGLIELL